MLIPFGVLSAAGAGGEPVFVDAFEHISTATGTGASGTIEFTSIPADYKHLQVRYTAKGTTTSNNMEMRMNNITSASYARHSLQGSGSTDSSNSSTSQTLMNFLSAMAGSTTAGRVASGVIDILDYASTSKNTTLRMLYGQTGATNVVVLASGLLNNTAAIDRLTFIAGAGSFTTVTRFSLYGIRG
jgi:hypothetical protein